MPRLLNLLECVPLGANASLRTCSRTARETAQLSNAPTTTPKSQRSAALLWLFRFITVILLLVINCLRALDSLAEQSYMGTFDNWRFLLPRRKLLSFRLIKIDAPKEFFIPIGYGYQPMMMSPAFIFLATLSLKTGHRTSPS